MKETVAAIYTQAGKQPMFIAFGFACLAVLGYVARINHEPVATAIAGVALSVFGGSAWKNHSDQAYKNGNGNGGGTPLPAAK